MTNFKNLVILIIVTAIMVTVTVALYSTKPASTGGFLSGTPLIQGLAPERVHSIVIKTGSDIVTIKRKDDGFTIAERYDYPASVNAINTLLIDCLDIRCKETVTSAAEHYDALGVADNSEDAVVVYLRDAEDKPIVGFIKGKDLPLTNLTDAGSYVRLTDKPTVYRTEQMVRIATRPPDYLDTTLISVKTEDIRQVAVQTDKSHYVINRDDNDKLSFETLPLGKEPKETHLRDVVSAITYMSLLDVIPADQFDLPWDSTYTCRLQSGLSYTIKLALKDKKYYAHFEAEAPNVDITISKTESEESLMKKEALVSAAETAHKFTPRHAAWVYEIPDWVAKRMQQPLGDLTKDIPQPTALDEIAASHILISYKGAQRSQATRTKEEAQELAKQVLDMAHALDADFPALVQEYSDDEVTKDKGGDLGVFSKGVMDPAFEEASFKLNIGQISNVVETPFSFHIIMRTK